MFQGSLSVGKSGGNRSSIDVMENCPKGKIWTLQSGLGCPGQLNENVGGVWVYPEAYCWSPASVEPYNPSWGVGDAQIIDAVKYTVK